MAAPADDNDITIEHPNSLVEARKSGRIASTGRRGAGRAFHRLFAVTTGESLGIVLGKIAVEMGKVGKFCRQALDSPLFY